MRRFYIIILLVVAYVAASCKSDNQFEYTNAIPKDAAAVGCVNVRTLLEKSGLGGSREAKEQIIKLAESACSAQVQALVEDLLSDLDNSGVDLTSPIYIAAYGEAASERMIVAKISDQESLERVLGVLKSEGVCQDIVGHGDYSTVMLTGGGAVVGYNESAVVLAGAGADFAAMLSREASESINSVEAFSKMHDERCDVEFMASWQACAEAMDVETLCTDKMASSLVISDLNFEGVYSYGGFNFDIGALSLYSNLCGDNARVNALFQNLLTIHKPIEGRFNKFNDKSTSLLVTIGVDGEELFSRIGTLMRTKGGELGLNRTQIDILCRVVSSLCGDVSVAMTQGGDLKAYAALSSADRGRKIVEKVQDEVGFDLGYENSSYMGIDRDMFFFTNSFDEYQYIDEPFAPSMEDVEFKNTEADNIILGYAGADYLVSSLSECAATRQFGEYLGGMNQLDHVEVFVNKSGRAEINFVLKDKSANALRSIISSSIINI